MHQRPNALFPYIRRIRFHGSTEYSLEGGCERSGEGGWWFCLLKGEIRDLLSIGTVRVCSFLVVAERLHAFDANELSTLCGHRLLFSFLLPLQTPRVNRRREDLLEASKSDLTYILGYQMKKRAVLPRMICRASRNE